MTKWTYTTRLINGKRRRVKYYKKSNGKYLVRMVSFRNYTDSGRVRGRRKR
ncbi:hypothetical protein ES702_01249 [subsurface metagenome]